MTKLIATLTLAAVAVMTFGPALSVAVTDNGIQTSLTKDDSGGAAPIVKAKWEANVDRYTDDSISAGAQFRPTGVYQGHRTIALCAIVTDPDGLADINNVYADVFYPNVALGEHHTPLADQSGLGCGELMQEDRMTRLEKMEGHDLFCRLVRTNNYNLPTFNSGYDYDEICAQDGQLMKETAAVWCVEKTISYEDPSGAYEVWAVAEDKTGKHGILKNHFTYLPVTAFETDFTSVAYGNVRLNTHKIISGDLTWGTNAKPTVRNVGNTRLSMKVWQDDMDLGKTSGQWNVRYDARVGSYASFVNYWPEETKKLKDPLDLSEMNEMDFSILISKFRPDADGNDFTGSMVLTAVSEDHLECRNCDGPCTQ